jgi:hypothetical protein
MAVAGGGVLQGRRGKTYHSGAQTSWLIALRKLRVRVLAAKSLKKEKRAIDMSVKE